MTHLALLAALFIVELLVASTFLDGAVLAGRTGIPGQIGIWGAWILRAIVGFAAAFVAFAGLQGGLKLSLLLQEADSVPVRWPWLYLHAAMAAGFGILSAALYQNGNLPYSDLIAIGWVLTGCGAILSACAAFLPRGFWLRLRERTGHVWIYAAAVSILATAFVRLSQSLWHATAQLTFQLVLIMLRPIFPDLIVQPERMRIRAPNFGVIIDQACSGLEGAGLMLIFVGVWLFLYRRDFRFPRSLFLIPIGVITLYFLNAVRIAALLIIGNAGAPQIAAGGFHSQAGWIAFNGVAFAMTIFVPKLRWFSLRPSEPVVTSGENPTATYLLPFMAILTTGMISRAMSADFEWLYALRFVAAAGTLWVLRRELRGFDWRFSWVGPFAGILVFGLWIGLDRWNQVPAAAMPGRLSAAQPFVQSLWIGTRLLAAVVTVPIAEELAFRGFLMRRLTAVGFETISFRQVSWLAILISSLVFGFLHGDRWIAGVLAGLVYAFVALRTNRIGECVAAHAVTNLLLGALVLLRDDWQYW